MSAKSVFKLVFSLGVFLLLLLMGLNNRDPVEFSLPPVLQETFQQPAALMYFAFFVVGVVTGAVLTLGGGKRKPIELPAKPN